MTKADALATALDELLAVSPDVEAAAVVSVDGLPIASDLPGYVEEDRLAAMSAAILTLGERAADNLGKGTLAQVFVEAENGYVVLMASGEEAVLVCVTNKNAKVGLVLFEMRRAAAKIAEIMERTSPRSGPSGSAGETEDQAGDDYDVDLAREVYGSEISSRGEPAGTEEVRGSERSVQ